MKLLLAADGHREERTIPPLIGTVLDVTLESAEFRAWKDLRVGGYGRKLLLAVRIARDAELQGVAAVVDRDKAGKGERLGKLQQGRDDDRQRQPSFPTALGEADPHVEAWLLDDPVAVRAALALESNSPIPSVTRAKNPKAKLHDLYEAAPANLKDS